MNNSRKYALLAFAVITLGVAVPQSDAFKTDQVSQIRVRLYNQARVPEEELTGAELQASRLLQSVGIHTIWINCTDQDIAPSACQLAYQPFDLVLRIVPNSAKLSVPDNAFGLALVADVDYSGVYAYVFYDPVRRLAAEHGASRSVILGHVFAHELGHLLLGSHSHSRNGLMTADWYGPQLRKAFQGGLRFDKSQAERVLANVRNRHSKASLKTVANR